MLDDGDDVLEATIDATWTTRFEIERVRLVALARRMLGSPVEADDVVQEAWLRLQRADAASVGNLGGWLTTTVSRLCLDRLRARRAHPTDVLDDDTRTVPTDAAGDDPERDAVVADAVGAALAVVLDSLTPAERVAFVLHDVFAVPFPEVAAVLDRSPEAARQLASRARRRVRVGASSAARVDPRQQREVVDAFLRAARGGDVDSLLRLLHPDAELRPDEAALRIGSLRSARGAGAVADLLAGGARAARLAIVDGLTALVWAPSGEVRGVLRFHVVDGRIVAIDVTGDAEQLRRLEIVMFVD